MARISSKKAKSERPATPIAKPPGGGSAASKKAIAPGGGGFLINHNAYTDARPPNMLGARKSDRIRRK